MSATGNILQVRSAYVCFYLLKSGDELYLIDTGFYGGMGVLDRTLQEVGWTELPIRGVLITHGHIDHIWNLPMLVKRHSPWIAAPALDRDLIAKNQVRNTGWGRLGTMGEGILRGLGRFQPPEDIIWLEDGQELPVMGIQAVSLPGHTQGHMGYRLGRWLFAGDLIGSQRKAIVPPPIFNEDEEETRRSICKCAAMDLEGLLPCHVDKSSPEEHWARLQKLAASLDDEAGSLHT